MIPLTHIPSLISYLKELKGKFHKLILFLDRASQHSRSKRVKEYLEKKCGVKTAEYFPEGSSPIEQYWRQGKDDLLVSNTVLALQI
jgi:hypothetical protein